METDPVNTSSTMTTTAAAITEEDALSDITSSSAYEFSTDSEGEVEPVKLSSKEDKIIIEPTTNDNVRKYSAEELLAMTDEEHLAWLESHGEIAGRYTDADPYFKDDKEDPIPPVVRNYCDRTNPKNKLQKRKHRSRRSPRHDGNDKSSQDTDSQKQVGGINAGNPNEERSRGHHPKKVLGYKGAYAYYEKPHTHPYQRGRGYPYRGRGGGYHQWRGPYSNRGHHQGYGRHPSQPYHPHRSNINQQKLRNMPQNSHGATGTGYPQHHQYQQQHPQYNYYIELEQRQQQQGVKRPLEDGQRPVYSSHSDEGFHSFEHYSGETKDKKHSVQQRTVPKEKQWKGSSDKVVLGKDKQFKRGSAAASSSSDYSNSDDD